MEVLDRADKLVRSPGKEALVLWRQTLPEASEEAGFLDDHANELVQLVFQTLGVYSDPKLQKGVLSYLRNACSQSETFNKTLAGSIVRNGPQKLSRQQALTLLQWSTIVIRNLDVQKAQKAVQKLIECQIAYLESIMRSGFKWVPVRMVLHPIWREKGGSLDVYTDALKSSGSAALAKSILSFTQGKAELMRDLKQIIMPIFLDKVLASRDPLSEEQIHAYDGLVKEISTQDVEGNILPHVFRLAKRSPESVLKNSTVFLAMKNGWDLSGSAEKAILELLPLLRHSKDSVRKAAAEFLTVFALKVQDIGSLQKMYSTIQKVLDGSTSGKIRNATERHGLLQGISSILASPNLHQSELANSATDFLINDFREEGNEEAKLENIVGLGLALGNASQISNQTFKHLSDGLQEKEVLRRAYLRALLEALRKNQSLRKSVQPVVSPLLKIAKDGVNKEPMRFDSILALYTLGMIAKDDSSIEDKLASENSWKDLFGEANPVLLSIDVAVRQNLEDTCIIAKFCGFLLSKFGAEFSANSNNSQLTNLLTALTLHHGSSVRNSALKCLESLSQADLIKILLSHRHWLRKGLPQSLITNPKSEEPSSESEIAGRRHRSILHVFEIGMKEWMKGSRKGELDGEIIGLTLQLICHPEVAGYLRTDRNPWQILQRKGVSGRSLLTSENIEAICAKLFGDSGLDSQYKSEVISTYTAVKSLVQDNTKITMPALIPNIEEALDRREAEKLSPREITIFNTPAGQLALSVDVSTIGGPNGIPQFSAMNGTHANPKGSLGIPNGTSKASKPVQKSEKKAVPVKSKSKDTAEERRNKQLQEEAEVRKRVADICEKLSRGLKVFSAACDGNHEWALEHIEELQALIQPLLQSPLVREGPAFDAEVSLAKSLPGKLGQHALSVATSLQIVELSRTGFTESELDLAEHSSIKSSIQAMSTICEGKKQLPLAAFKLCYPILAAILSLPEITSLHESAMNIISLHVGPNLDIPRGKMLGLMYHVLGIIPAYRAKVQSMVTELCKGSKEENLVAAFSGLLEGDPHVRAVALASIPHIPLLSQGTPLSDVDLVTILWLCQADPDVANAETSLELWEKFGCELQPGFIDAILPHLRSKHADVRQASAEALAFGIEETGSGKESVLSKILDLYANHRNKDARTGVALALQSCSYTLSTEDSNLALNFLLEEGVKDDDPDVRSQMVDAGVAIVDAHGNEEAQNLLPLFEDYLAKPTPENELLGDRMRQGAVVFLGTLASHMESGNPKVKDIVERLFKVLRTPNMEVQKSAAACLPAITASLKSDKPYIKDLIGRLIEQILKGKTLVDRNGAALGLAGVVKGLKIVAVNGYGILKTLKDGIQDKEADSREGALFAFRALVDTLGRLFEPYIVECLSDLLERFGDGNDHVRDANQDLAQTIMANLSNAGVKLTLPTLLEGVDAKIWRKKQGSVEMLGNMAHLAPQPLSTALPKVVPKLSQALSDPHPKVQLAAKRALKEVGSVIRNPEIQKMVPNLMNAISDPEKHGKKALDQLLGTTFVNTVDAPSLALIVPVVYKSLRDRSGDSKKRAARIVGSMCSLMNDPKDMAPYVPLLLPGLQQALIDPLPDVRATSAKAVGSLLGGMGPQHSEDLMPWLLNTLKSEGSSVERSGAAQGLAEVLAVLGQKYIDGLLPEILQSCKAKNANVREGNLTLFKFLPGALGDSFQEYLQTILPAILSGLADESEGVRNAALAAGRTFVEFYAQTSLPLLLPTVEAGIVNDNWRIRQSSIDLLGDLLFKVAGTSGKVRLDENEEEGLSTEAHGAAIIEALGLDRRNQILSKVYLARTDVGLSVRSAAVHVWKTLVTNTPRTLKEILSCLMENVISLLAGDGEEQQQMAGSCLGELVRKMGDQVLRQIIPIFQERIKDPSPATRVGVCTGLTHLLENIGNHQLKEHLSHLLPTVQRALVDPNPEVQQAAGQAFAVLFRGGGHSAVDSIVPSMLMSLTNDNKQAAQALEGLRVILSVRPQTLGVMLPKLLRPQCTPTSMKALASLAEVAGSSIHGHLGTTLPPLLRAASSDTTQEYQAADLALKKISGAVGEEGVYLLIGQLEKSLEDPVRRLASANCIAYFCETTKHDFQEHIPGLITNMLSLMAEEDENLLKALWTALGSVTSKIPKDQLAFQLQTVRDALATAKEKQRRKRKAGDLLVPGCCLPKILGPILPIYLQAVLQGTSAELRENAATGLGELVEVTAEDALKPFVVQMTGPLIRIIGDRFPWEVKAAILKTLGLLINKAGLGLKPFVPQLQTTFLKCLPDPASLVRRPAAQNLGALSGMSVRIEALANDLLTQAKSASTNLKEPYLVALQGVLRSSGSRLSQNTLSTAGEALQDLLQNSDEEESNLRAITNCLGELAKVCSETELKDILEKGVWPRQKDLSASMLISSIAQTSPQRLEEAQCIDRIVVRVNELAKNESSSVREGASYSAGNLALAEISGVISPVLSRLVPVIVALLSPDQASEVQRIQMHVLRTLAFRSKDALVPYFSELIPSLCSLLSGAGPTKLATERTLARVLQASENPEIAQSYLALSGPGTSTSRSILSETYLRRLAKLPLDDAEDSDFNTK